VQYIKLIVEAASENFNVTTVRPHWGAIYSQVSDVDEASVSYVDKYVVKGEKVRADDWSRCVHDDKMP